MIVFDIETGPLDGEQLQTRVAPFEPPPHPGEFDSSTVKLGNTKDKDKIKEKIDAARAAHTLQVEQYEGNVEQLQREWWASVLPNAALSPMTGRILAIGYLSTDSDHCCIDIDEEYAMLMHFWEQYLKCRQTARKMVGHNIMQFDVPFIIRRSWFYKINVPSCVIERGRWIDWSTFADTMALWSCGTRDNVKLDLLSRALGVGKKLDGMDGSMFYEVFANDREKAIEYLRNDLLITRGVAEAMGVI